MNTLPERQTDTITEVLVEPGQFHLWVTISGTETHRVDLNPLLRTDTHQALNLRRLFTQVRIGYNARHLTWPGGYTLDAFSIYESPDGRLPVRPLVVLPAEQRFRPLFPYLRSQQPPVYLHPEPVQPGVVVQLLQLRPGELESMLQSLPVPTEVLLARVYDLALFLSSHFASEHLYALMRRPWRYAQQECAGQPLLDTMLGCLLHGRPDLIERPCQLIATGATGGE